jgi:hypothetical protein
MEKKKLTIVEYPNALGSGVNVKIVHHPIMDGPIELYKNRSDCKVVIMEI